MREHMLRKLARAQLFGRLQHNWQGERDHDAVFQLLEHRWKHFLHHNALRKIGKQLEEPLEKGRLCMRVSG